MKYSDLPRLSRDRIFLIKTSIVIVAISLVLAATISFFGKESKSTATPTLPESMNSPEQLLSFIRNPLMATMGIRVRDSHDILTGEKHGSKVPGSISALIDQVKGLEESDVILFTKLYLGLRGGKVDEAIKAIEATPEDARFHFEFLGDLYREAGEKKKSIEAYQNEVKNHPASTYSRRSALLGLWSEEEHADLRELLSDSKNREVLSVSEKMDIFSDTRNYGGLFLASIDYCVDEIGSIFVIPATITAFIWFLILIAFVKPDLKIVSLSLIAFFAGIFSTAITLFLVLVQERIQGFDAQPDDSPLVQVIGQIAGVGLREETSKLLCFLPFAIFLSRKPNDLFALLTAGMVGLGFAAQENINYYGGDLNFNDYTVWGRFLSANALHIALTGTIGFWFYRMLVRKGWGWEDFLLNFILMVVAHGLYNSMISVPGVSDYGPLSYVVLALIAYRYFDPLKSKIDIRSLHRRISPLGVFVVGSVCIACATLVFTSFILPLRIAFGAFCVSVGSMIPLAFVYINRFRDI